MLQDAPRTTWIPAMQNVMEPVSQDSVHSRPHPSAFPLFCAVITRNGSSICPATTCSIEKIFLQAPRSSMRTGHKMSQRIHPKVSQTPFLTRVPRCMIAPERMPSCQSLNKIQQPSRKETSRNHHPKSRLRESWSTLADHYVVEFPVFISQS